MITVLEFEEHFGVFHLAADDATEATCGRRGRLLRLLPHDTWEGAPGPFPATFCGRCAVKINVPTRTEQLLAVRAEIMNRLVPAAGGRAYWSGTSADDWLYYRKWKSGQAGVGHVTLEREAERLRPSSGFSCNSRVDEGKLCAS